MANLTIIAGPNGAGKSTGSNALLKHENISAFDYDYELKTAWANFGFDPSVEQGVRDSVAKKFEDAKKTAIGNNADFAFETNYHSEEIINTLEQFKISGFQTELLFIALENSGYAIERVRDRVAKGGHNVSEPTIIERFNKGLELLDSTFKLYSTVSLWLSEKQGFTPIALIDNVTNEVHNFQSVPVPLQTVLPNLLKFINRN